jgi:4-diphosphocytidyl-2-C-methyl-D-erythritol kinase
VGLRSIGNNPLAGWAVADLMIAHLEECSIRMDVHRSGSAVQVECPAKVNLFLEVLAKRADGFHDIETLMTAISIYDSLIVTEAEEGRIRVTCDWVCGMEAKRAQHGDCELVSLPGETDNLVYQAAQRLRSQAGVDQGASIQLTKRIPVEAGLGGASSDAAATLLALNTFWRLNWSREQLAELASELGSDIPFFLLDRPGSMAAVCRGRGERITKLQGVIRGALVVVKPADGLSTAKVYGQCSVPRAPVSVEPLVSALQTGRWNEIGRALFNRLQEVAERLSPRVREMREICERLDVVGHAMSGSGTSYFAICRSDAQACHLASRLRAMRCGLVFQASMI